MKAVLMLYPLKEFVDRDERDTSVNSFNLSTWGDYWSKVFDITKDVFRDRFRLINKLIEPYRDDDYKIIWAVFSDPKNYTISDVFDLKDDYKVNVDVKYIDFIKEWKYPDEKNVLENLGDIEKLVIGGFHQSDCCQRFNNAALTLGIDVFINRYITDEFFQRMLNTFEQDLYQNMIKVGTLDAEMHEDDPYEVKCGLFDHSLDEYF
ncbi:MAG: hypothetical protein K0B02_02000 [DPANN group archaeon]|nr:hypothetical protein [DPANN group archaeon]